MRRNGTLVGGIAAIRDAQGDLTPGHLMLVGLSRRQADNALGYALRLRLVRRVARGVYRRANRAA